MVIQAKALGLVALVEEVSVPQQWKNKSVVVFILYRQTCLLCLVGIET